MTQYEKTKDLKTIGYCTVQDFHNTNTVVRLTTEQFAMSVTPSYDNILYSLI